MEDRNYKVYMHTAPNDKKYIGITKLELEVRCRNGRGYKNNKHFYNAINKYGWNNIKHEVLFDNLTKEEACLLEQCYIALYDTTNSKYGFNNTTGGEHYTPTEEAKRRNSEAHKGKCVGEKNGMFGKHHSEETRKKMSEQRSGENHPWYGRKHTEESKEKNRIAHIGKKQSEETRNKKSKASKKAWADPNSKLNSPEYKLEKSIRMKEVMSRPEVRKKNSESHKGKKFSEETRKKMSENSGRSRKVRCIELNKPFNCIADAKKWLGKGDIGNALRKGHKAGGYHWEYV